MNLINLFQALSTTEMQQTGENLSVDRSSALRDLDPDRIATVTQTIRPGRTGQVKFQGSWWTARCSQDVFLIPGQVVYVLERRNICLYVQPAGQVSKFSGLHNEAA